MHVMTKPIPDKAEVVLEYPDKFYIGTFERSSRFDAHLDDTGISLLLDRPGDVDARKSVHMHIHYALFADILRDLAKTVAAMPPEDEAHRVALRDAAKALHDGLVAAAVSSDRGRCQGDERQKLGDETADDISSMTPEEEVLLLHVME
jgi:hypothetical protein